MNTTLDELHSAVLSLPEAERARLAARILASLDEDGATDAAWVSEVRERLAAYRRGEIGAVAAEAVLDKTIGMVRSGASGNLATGRTQRVELDRRLATHANRPGAAIPWAVLRAELLARG